MGRVACYVDGFNLYHALDALAQPKFKWLNLVALAESFLRPGEQLVATYYFTAYLTQEATKHARHRRYVDALSATGVEVVISKFQRVDKFCRRAEQSCPFLEEKQTDVALATRFLADAMENFMDRAILVTADSDHVPVVKLVGDKRPLIELTLAPPPGRMAQARDLGAFIRDKREIETGRMGRCLLPRTVYTARGTVAATCPAPYIPVEM